MLSFTVLLSLVYHVATSAARRQSQCYCVIFDTKYRKGQNFHLFRKISRQDVQVFNRFFTFHESDLFDVDEELFKVDMESGFHCA